MLSSLKSTPHFRGVSLLLVRLSIPRRWIASEIKAATQSRDIQGETSPLTDSCLCVLAAGQRRPPGLLPVACPSHHKPHTPCALYIACPAHHVPCTSHAPHTMYPEHHMPRTWHVLHIMCPAQLQLHKQRGSQSTGKEQRLSCSCLFNPNPYEETKTSGPCSPYLKIP